jgi:hypothetical protein
MDQRIVPLIMCGGAGTRLWPASREVRPKQFLSLFGKRSTFQDTVLRVSDQGLFERPIVITNAAYRFMVLEQLAEMRPTSCSSRCGAIRVPRSRPVRCSRKRAMATRSFWRWPPITSCRTRRPLSPPAGRDWSQPRAATS